MSDAYVQRSKSFVLPIRQLRKRLSVPPAPLSHPEIAVRTFCDSDVDSWLQLRQRCFAAERRGVREWMATDFEREIRRQAWWRPDRCWLAEPVAAPTVTPSVGGVIQATRGRAGGQQLPAVHWLMVDPPFRRQGIATLLLTTLESAVWNAGGREIVLETHTDWAAAMGLYARLGYQ